MSKRKIAIIVFAILVIIGVVLFFLLRGRISATTMRILRLEGNVSLQDDSGMKTVKENLRLTSGNVLDTSTESLVSIGLDEVKIVTLDELSRAEFNQSGKKLNLDLTKGSLFFEVDKPLADDETFEIETSTMIVGIRGTSGWVSVDGENESLIITDGHVHVIGTNPVTGEVKEVDVNAGQRLVVYLYNDREVDSIMFELEDVTEHELSKFVINILRNKASLLDKVIAATGWDRDYILGISDAEPEPDSDDPGTQVADADPKPEPEPEPEPDPIVPDVGGNDDPKPAQDNTGNNNAGNNNNTNNNNNNNNNGNNTGVTTADTLVTAPVTRTELEKQIDAANAQIVSINANGTYTLSDNTVFDPAYYGQAYPDVVAQYGNTSEALLAHYVATGQSEGRYASQSEQDAAKLAEDIARLEAQRIADEANSGNNQNNANTNTQPAQTPAQQQNTPVTVPNNYGSYDSSNGNFSYGDTTGSYRTTSPKFYNLGNSNSNIVTVPSTMRDTSTGTDYTLTFDELEFDPANCYQADVTELTTQPSVSQLVSYFTANTAHQDDALEIVANVATVENQWIQGGTYSTIVTVNTGTGRQDDVYNSLSLLDTGAGQNYNGLDTIIYGSGNNRIMFTGYSAANNTYTAMVGSTDYTNVTLTQNANGTYTLNGVQLGAPAAGDFGYLTENGYEP